jgi:hypothetical protein
MASVVLSGDTSGSITVTAPAVAGSTTQTLVAVTGTLAPIVSGTAVASTSGTSIDFTSIPSWVKRITVMFNGVSTNGTSIPMVQLGDSGGVEITGYAGAAWIANTTNTAMSSGFLISGASDGSYVYSGVMTISLIGSNAWAASGTFGLTGAVVVAVMGGAKTLSDTLDRVRITTVGGVNTFDAGTINILYE